MLRRSVKTPFETFWESVCALLVKGLVAGLTAGLTAGVCGSASGYYNNDRWQSTATDGAVGPVGTPVTLTWGLANDGTTVPNVTPGVHRNSNLIASLDGWYGAGDGGADLTTRPWFGYLEDSMNRWAELSGLDFVYEPADDGGPHNLSLGLLGVRADIRLAGARYDGTVGTNLGTVGYSIAPDQGDVFLDTDDTGYYGDPAGDAFKLRHTLMHEVGHSLGLGHLNSVNSYVLMEAFLQDEFDGPQIDDIRGIQFLYGDAYEKNGGNDTVATATPLGVLGDGTFTLGADTEAGSFIVTPEMTDFVSINRSADVDVFSFSLASPAEVELTLTPVGRTYAHQPEGGSFTVLDSSEVGDLALEFEQQGLVLGSADSGGVGMAETLGFGALAAGDFAVRITGQTPGTQLYRLDLAVTCLGLAGDYTGDGLVDAADYTLWRDSLGSTENLAADGDGSGQIDSPDYGVWSGAYGDSSAPAKTVPEPSAGLLVRLLATSAVFWLSKR